MGVALSVVAGTIGAVELISFIHYISDEWLLQHLRTQNKDSLDSALVKYQDEIRQSIEDLERRDSRPMTFMDDGIAYENGYRVDEISEEARSKFEQKLKDILRHAHIGDQYENEQLAPQNLEFEATEPQIEEFSIDETEINVDGVVNSESENVGRKIEFTSSEQFIHNEIVGNERGAVESDSLKSDDIKTIKYSDPYKRNTETSDENNGGASANLNSQLSSRSETFPEIDENDDPTEYSEEYLRALDGVKNRPLVRDDGTGRRRAFKKRNSSGSSSQESRLSREEELKMFTSLEEEEFQQPKNLVPIKYSSEPQQKVSSSKKHRRRNKKQTDLDISELDEDESDDSRSRKSSMEMIDELPKENLTHPWGDIKPELRRDGATCIKNFRRETSIDEKPEFENENEKLIAEEKAYRFDPEKREQARIAMQKMKTPDPEFPPKVEAFDDASEAQHDEMILKQRPGVNNNDVESSDNKQDTQSNKVSTPEPCGDEHAVPIIALSTNTTINITNNNNATNDNNKLNELTFRLQKIEQAIEQNISDWASQNTTQLTSAPEHFQVDDAIEDGDDANVVESDEEPFYDRKPPQRRRKRHIDSDAKLETDFLKVLEDNEIDLNEDCSYLPYLGSEAKYLDNSDEEPDSHRSHMYQLTKAQETHNKTETDESGSDNYDPKFQKRQQIRKHKRPPMGFDSDEEPTYMPTRVRHKRKTRDDSVHECNIHKNIDMIDELSDEKDEQFVVVDLTGREKEYVLDSDDEPYLRALHRSQNLHLSYLTTHTCGIPHYSHQESVVSIPLDSSDEQPMFDSPRCTGAIPKSSRLSISHETSPAPHPIEGGHVQEHSYNSDEEPDYQINKIIYHKGDTDDEDLENNHVEQEHRRLKLFDEYDIESSEEYRSFSNAADIDRIDYYPSDSEVYNNELMEAERARRSLSPSREREKDLSTDLCLEMSDYRESGSPTVINLGLIGGSKNHRITAMEEEVEMTVVVKTKKRYKWEESVSASINTYERTSSRDVGEGFENEGKFDDYEDDDIDEDQMWASETDTTQKSVIERHNVEEENSENDNAIEELQEEEVVSEEARTDQLDEGAVGGVTADVKESSPKTFYMERSGDFNSDLKTELFGYASESNLLETKENDVENLDIPSNEEDKLENILADNPINQDFSSSDELMDFSRNEMGLKHSRKMLDLKSSDIKDVSKIKQNANNLFSIQERLGHDTNESTVKLKVKSDDSFLESEVKNSTPAVDHEAENSSNGTKSKERKKKLKKKSSKSKSDKSPTEIKPAFEMPSTYKSPIEETHVIHDSLRLDRHRNSPSIDKSLAEGTSSECDAKPSHSTSTLPKQLPKQDTMYLLKESMYPFY